MNLRPMLWICWENSQEHDQSLLRKLREWSISFTASSVQFRCSWSRVLVKLLWFWDQGSWMQGILHVWVIIKVSFTLRKREVIKFSEMTFKEICKNQTNLLVKVPMKRTFFPHNIKISCLEYTISKFEFPTIKIVNFTSTQSWAILPSKMAFESRSQNVMWHQSVTSVCVLEILNIFLIFLRNIFIRNSW